MPNLTGNTTTIDKIAETKDPIETGVVLYGSSTGTETTKMKLHNIFEKTAFMKLKTAAKNIIDAINELKNRTDKLNTDMNKVLSSMVLVRNYELDNQVLEKGKTKYFDVPITTITDYDILNFDISIINATNNGGNSSGVFCYHKFISGENVRAALKNTLTVDAKIKVSVRMTYIYQPK